MKSNELISVIIPTFGRTDSLGAAVDSVLSQTYSELEVIIVDDNSDIKNSKIVQDILSKYSADKRIVYYGDGINRGGSGARNKGIEISQGKYITFLDDDDLYLQTKIKQQYDFLNAHNLDACACDMYFSENGTMRDISNCYARIDSLKEFILNGNCYTPMLFARKNVLEAIGGFTITPRFQDHLLTLKLLSYTNKIRRLPEKLFIHNYHKGERITYSKKSIQAYKLREEMERQHIDLLNEDEVSRFEFSKALINMKICRLNLNANGMISNIKICLKNMKSIKQGVSLFKTITRVALFGNKMI